MKFEESRNLWGLFCLFERTTTGYNDFLMRLFQVAFSFQGLNCLQVESEKIANNRV